MRTVRFGMLALAAVALVGFAGNAYAFHAGGVAECGGCHSMHSPTPGGSFLLVGTDASSACLTCHENPADTGPSSYRVSTPDSRLGPGQSPIHRTPGGDFGWLKKDYTFTVRGTTSTELGETHGHNIIAADYGYGPDLANTQAPGGSGFPSAQLGCESCHDPHGQYRRLEGNVVSKTGGAIKASGSYPGTINEPDALNPVGVYRLLAGAGYTKDGITFQGVPAAKVPSTYNRTEAATQTRTAYGHATTNGQVGWGDWCATCHPDMHSQGGNYVHPVDDTLGYSIAQIYNQYVKTGDMTGSGVSSFTSLVPFVTNSADYGAVLAPLAKNDDTALGGPATSDRVSCLSCHRAHASGWMHALRWNMEGELMTYNGLYPGTDNGAPAQFARGRTEDEHEAAYYDRPATVFANYQRVLCNKCHAKD